MTIFSSKYLSDIGKKLLVSHGLSSEDSKVIVDSLIKSNLMGHDSHGIQRLPYYIGQIKKQEIKINVQPTIVNESPNTALIDCKWGAGQLSAFKGTKIAINKAKQNGISSVSLFHNNHIGRLGEYVEKITQEDLIGLIMCNSAGMRFSKTVTPYGGVEGILGTNPLALGLPSDNHPFILDIATAIVAEGKIRHAVNTNQKIPENWIIDKNGKSTSNPHALYDGGALRPFGNYKGYGLSLFIEIICMVLAGQGIFTTESENRVGSGVFIIVINPEKFRPIKDFKKTVTELFSVLKNSKTDGVNEILIPGEPEYRQYQKRVETGIPIPDNVCEQLGIGENKKNR